MLLRHPGGCVAPILIALVAAACGRAADAPAPRPNVVLILADDLGWADLGCYGSKYHKTPHLDKLAAAGTRFTNAYAACPVCSPTRAALMTGKYPARLNLTDWLPGRTDRPDQKLLRPAITQELSAAETTLAAALKSAGYATGHVGKWHLGGKGAGPEQRGFDSNIAGDQAGSPLSYFAPYQRQNRFMPGLEKAPEGEYLTDRLGAEAVKFIDSNKDGPFFLYLAQYAPHIPMRAKADLIKKYPDKPAPPRCHLPTCPVAYPAACSSSATVGTSGGRCRAMAGRSRRWSGRSGRPGSQSVRLRRAGYWPVRSAARVGEQTGQAA